MLGRTNTGGGGSGGLNFQVIGGTTAPSNPKENMIWVNTSTKITSYIFSATQPTGSAGMVWISTGTSSPSEFNALKKNGIQVYPLSAKQYVSGAWVDVTAKSYQGGEWVEWITYLYNEGDECTDITGGWITRVISGTTTPSVTKKADRINITAYRAENTTHNQAMVYTDDSIDISGAELLCVDVVKNSGTPNGHFVIGVAESKTINSYNDPPKLVAYTSINDTGTFTLRVDNIDAGYVLVGWWSNSAWGNNDGECSINADVLRVYKK